MANQHSPGQDQDKANRQHQQDQQQDQGNRPGQQQQQDPHRKPQQGGEMNKPREDKAREHRSDAPRRNPQDQTQRR